MRNLHGILRIKIIFPVLLFLVTSLQCIMIQEYWETKVHVPGVEEDLGFFRPTFYRVVDENEERFSDLPKDTPVLGVKGDTIAMVTAKFERLLNLEGTGKLADGRLLNFARWGENREILYRVVENCEWGLGVQNAEWISEVESYKLVPYRTIAVDPKVIPIGSVVYIPAIRGIRLPTGETHDGYFLAHDIGGAIKEKRIDIFVGPESDTHNTFTKRGILNMQPLKVFSVSDSVTKKVNNRFRYQYTLSNKRLYEMTWEEIELVMCNILRVESDVNKRIEFYSELAKGTPKVLFCLGEGPDGKYDKDPLIDLARADCMTFVEQTLALAISKNYKETFDNLQKIRYKDGIIDFKKRNHFTIADWLSNNEWLLEDVTEKISQSFCKEMTKIIDRRKTFARMGCTDTVDVSPPETLTVKYIPKNKLLAIEKNLEGGEIVSLIQNKSGIFSYHMGIIAKDRNNKTIFRHSSTSAKKVVDESYKDLVGYLRRDKNIAGVIFMRAKDIGF
jgi:3D (Asp-Asp-Asp) domain-containing protein